MKLLYRYLRQIALHITLISFANPGFAQLKDKHYGAYRSLLDFQNNRPSYIGTFEKAGKTKKKTTIYILQPAVKEAAIKPAYDAWMVYDNSGLYINRRYVKMGNGFYRMEETGMLCYFIGQHVKTVNETREIAEAAFWLGAAGYANAMLEVKRRNKDEVHFLLNLETGVVHTLNPGYLEMMMQPFAELHERYIKEPEAASVETMLAYLKELNKEYETNR
jgi:hypothetical protein